MKRPSKSLPFSLEHRLSGYALAASAAGVSLLALKPPAAEARIIYIPTHQVLKSSFDSRYFLFFGPNQRPAFQLEASTCSTTNCGRGGRSAYLRIGNIYTNSGTNFIAVGGTSCETWDFARCALALKKGTKIPTGAHGSLALMAQRETGGRGYTGFWLPGTKNRYLGLTFHLNGEIHYGWARMSVRGPHHRPEIVAVLTGYAYETIPNKPIIAGKTRGPDVITLQPATLGHLARGASAIPAWRQNEQ